MKFWRLDLLTLLISLFIFSSCKNQNGIGLDPDQKLSGTLLVDTNIVVNTVPEDSVNTTGNPSTIGTSLEFKSALGYINDSQIGTTQASIAMGLSLPGSTAYTLPTGTITIDSARLVLRYTDGFYGDSLTTHYKVDVYQLNEKISATKSYYNTKTWSYNNTLLGTKTFNSRTHTPIKITDIVSGGPDTIKSVPEQVRIHISSGFINSNLFNASSTILSSNTLFQDNIKCGDSTFEKPQVNGAGGNFMIALDSCSVNVYCRIDNSGTIDTTIISLPVARHAVEIKHTYTAAVQAALNNTSTSNNTFYLQGLAGLRAKVSFPGLKDIITQAGIDIVINRAELVITPAPGTTIPLTPLPKITMYQLDIAKTRIPLQDADVGNRNYQSPDIFGGYYSSNNGYHFIITGYIQDLMRGRAVDYGTYIAPCDTVTTSSTGQSLDYLATPQAAARVVAVGTPGKTSADYPYRIKLNLIYTKVNK